MELCHHEYLVKQGFQQLQADPCIYISQSPFLFVGVYVDDISTVGKAKDALNFRYHFRKEFLITQGGKSWNVNTEIVRWQKIY
jgi:hypothetical protein